MKSFISRFSLFAVLALALCGYFLDLECLVNQCNKTVIATAEHGECLSPVILSDRAPRQLIVSEFYFIPALLHQPVTVLALFDKPVAGFIRSQHRPPPELVLAVTTLSRRGPPTLV